MPSFCLSYCSASTAASSESKTAYASPDERPSALRIRWMFECCSVGGEPKNWKISSTVAVNGSPRIRSTPLYDASSRIVARLRSHAAAFSAAVDAKIST